MPISGRAALETIAGVPVYVAEPESIPSGNRDKAMVLFHGGGLVMGGGEAVGLFARLEAFKTSCRVYAVDFGNPPDHPYPGALNDGVAVYTVPVLSARGAQLGQHPAKVVLRPFFRELPGVVVAEDVLQVEDESFSRRRERADRRRRELPLEHAGHPRLRGDPPAVDQDVSARDREVGEGAPHRGKIAP